QTPQPVIRPTRRPLPIAGEAPLLDRQQEEDLGALGTSLETAFGSIIRWPKTPEIFVFQDRIVLEISVVDISAPPVAGLVFGFTLFFVEIFKLFAWFPLLCHNKHPHVSRSSPGTAGRSPRTTSYILKIRTFVTSRRDGRGPVLLRRSR